jgi:hypothetical protein
MHDELRRQIFEALGASGCAIRGAECRCASVNHTVKQILTPTAEAMNSAQK